MPQINEKGVQVLPHSGDKRQGFWGACSNKRQGASFTGSDCMKLTCYILIFQRVFPGNMAALVVVCLHRISSKNFFGFRAGVIRCWRAFTLWQFIRFNIENVVPLHLWHVYWHFVSNFRDLFHWSCNALRLYKLTFRDVLNSQEQSELNFSNSNYAMQINNNPVLVAWQGPIICNVLVLYVNLPAWTGIWVLIKSQAMYQNECACTSGQSCVEINLFNFSEST